MPSKYRVTFVDGAGQIVEYHVDGFRIPDMIRAAIEYMDVRANDCTIEEFEVRLAEANRFATFVVNETLDEFGEFCDPRGNLSELRHKWRMSEASAA